MRRELKGQVDEARPSIAAKYHKAYPDEKGTEREDVWEMIGTRFSVSQGVSR